MIMQLQPIRECVSVDSSCEEAAGATKSGGNHTNDNTNSGDGWPNGWAGMSVRDLLTIHFHNQLISVF
jgi:hypothetical protein